MSENRPGRVKPLLVLFVLLFVSFVMMGFSQKKVTIRFKSVAFSVFYPFQYVGVSTITLTKDFFSSIKKNRDLKRELNQTRALLEEYKRTQFEFEEMKRENEKLRRLIGFQSELEYDTVIAGIVAKSPQNFYKTLIVNRGKQSGIRKWMPVIAYQDGVKCVVGKIVDVQPYSSRVQPLIEQTSYIGAMLKDSRYSGILATI